MTAPAGSFRPEPRLGRARAALPPLGATLTTRGRCLLAGGLATAVCAVLLDERDLLRVGVFITALPLLAIGFTFLARAGVRAERDLDPPRLPVGHGSTVRILLRRPASVWLRVLWLGELLLTDTVPDAASARRASSPTFRLTRLPLDVAAELRYALVPVLRGRYPIGPLTARGTDPLGLAEFERNITAPSPLLVLPMVVALRSMPASLGNDLLDAATARRQHGPGSADLTVREYRQGDELRRVHWRSTARRDELMVRVEERARRGGVTILLDRRQIAHRGYGPAASLEWAVSLVASAYLHLTARGISVTVVTEDGATLAPGRSGDAVLDALAELRPSSTATLSGVALPGAGADAMIAVLGAVHGEDPAQLVRRAPTPAGHAVLLDVGTWSGRPESERTDVGAAHAAADTLRAAGWSAGVAQSGTRVDIAWERLCATTPVPT